MEIIDNEKKKHLIYRHMNIYITVKLNNRYN